MSHRGHPLPRLLATMERIQHAAGDLFPTDPVAPTYEMLVIGGLLTESLAAHTANRLLLENRLTDEAGVLTRKQMETSVVLVYFGSQVAQLPQLALEFMYFLCKRELTLWKEDLRVNRDKRAREGLQAVIEQMRELKQQWRALGNTGKVPDFPSTIELLRAMRQDQDGRGLLMRGHLYVHLSRMGLEGRLNESLGEQQQAVAFDVFSHPDRTIRVGALSSTLLLSAAEGAGMALEWGQEYLSAIRKLREQSGKELQNLIAEVPR